MNYQTTKNGDLILCMDYIQTIGNKTASEGDEKKIIDFLNRLRQSEWFIKKTSIVLDLRNEFLKKSGI